MTFVSQLLSEYGTLKRPNTRIVSIGMELRLKPYQKLLGVIGENLASFRHGTFIVDVKKFLCNEDGTFYKVRKQEIYWYQPPNYGGWNYGIKFDPENGTYELGKVYLTDSELKQISARWGKKIPVWAIYTSWPKEETCDRDSIPGQIAYLLK